MIVIEKEIITEIHVDGGYKDKVMSIGIFAKSSSYNIKFCEKLGAGNSQKAEALAIYKCIQILRSIGVIGKITIRSDQTGLCDALNTPNITSKQEKNFPEAIEIREFLKNNKCIDIKWIESKHNLAHKLVQEAHKGVFLNEITINKIKNPEIKKEELNIDVDNNNNLKNNTESDYIIEHLLRKIKEKDALIEELLAVIKHMNSLKF